MSSVTPLTRALSVPLQFEGGLFFHAFSMAHNRAKVKGLWTLAQASQLMEHLRFANQHAVDLGCFVSLAFA